MIRWPLVFVLIGLAAAAVVFDRVSTMPTVAIESRAELDVQTPIMSDPPQLNSAWYCPAGSSSPGGFADHEVVIANLSESPAVANLTVLTGEGQGAGRRVELEPQSTQEIALSDSQESTVAGAVVEIIAGEGAVGHRVRTAQGVAEGPCATAVSNEWIFAGGRTEVDSKQYLALMNPFPETAVFSVEFRTLARRRQPQALRGAFVPARSVRVIEVGEYISNESSVATIVTTERGRLVAERLQVLDGELGAEGAALQLGVATPATSWILPAGRIHSGGDHILTVFNPAEPVTPVIGTDPETGEETVVEADDPNLAVIDIEIWPNNPTDLSLYGVVTATREVRPGNFEVIDLGAQAARFGFPLPYELGVRVTSQNQMPIVVERWHVGEQLQERSVLLDTSDDDDDADNEDSESPQGDFEIPVLGIDEEPLLQPIASTGLGTSRGVEQLSQRWVIPWVSINGDSTTVAIAATDEAAVEVRVLANGSFAGPFRVTVPAGGRRTVPLSVPGVEGGAVEIVADAPVAVEALVVEADQRLDVVAAVPTVRRQVE